MKSFQHQGEFSLGRKPEFVTISLKTSIIVKIIKVAEPIIHFAWRIAKNWKWYVRVGLSGRDYFGMIQYRSRVLLKSCDLSDSVGSIWQMPILQ
jgi:hypothetical protein